MYGVGLSILTIQYKVISARLCKINPTVQYYKLLAPPFFLSLFCHRPAHIQNKFSGFK